MQDISMATTGQLRTLSKLCLFSSIQNMRQVFVRNNGEYPEVCVRFVHIEEINSDTLMVNDEFLSYFKEAEKEYGPCRVRADLIIGTRVTDNVDTAPMTVYASVEPCVPLSETNKLTHPQFMTYRNTTDNFSFSLNDEQPFQLPMDIAKYESGASMTINELVRNTVHTHLFNQLDQHWDEEIDPVKLLVTLMETASSNDLFDTGDFKFSWVYDSTSHINRFSPYAEYVSLLQRGEGNTDGGWKNLVDNKILVTRYGAEEADIFRSYVFNEDTASSIESIKSCWIDDEFKLIFEYDILGADNFFVSKKMIKSRCAETPNTWVTTGMEVKKGENSWLIPAYDGNCTNLHKKLMSDVELITDIIGYPQNAEQFINDVTGNPDSIDRHPLHTLYDRTNDINMFQMAYN